MKTPTSLQRIETQMTAVEPGTVRYEALAAARSFKTSWIALGRALAAVFQERAYKEWGYLTFEAYCAREIGIQPLTAKKLLRSYAFLQQHEPRLLQAEGSKAIPANRYPTYEAVDVLRQAKERAGLPERAYDELRERVLEQGEPAPAARKELRMVLRRAQPPEEAEANARRDRQAALRRLIGTLRAIHRAAAEGRLLPAGLLRDTDRLAQRLEAAVQDVER